MAAMAAEVLVLSVVQIEQRMLLQILAVAAVELLPDVPEMGQAVVPALSLFATQHLLPQALMQFQKFLAPLVLAQR